MTYRTDGSDGGPAFPQFELVAGERDGHGDAIEAFTVTSGGMSLRDWFAGQALTSLDGVQFPHDGQRASVSVAKLAYEIADAMLEARFATRAALETQETPL